MTAAERTVRIAAVQPALRLGEVEQNLRRVEDLIRDAHREHAPQAIVLPEGIAAPNVFHRSLRHTVQPVDGAPMQLMRGLARELDVVVCGGFVARRGADSYGTYAMAEPDGALHLHDKDIPTAWENNYYRGGDDDGVVRSNTLDASVGMPSGWEWARFATAGRMVGRVDLVLGGMCWPSFPLNWRGPAGWWGRREHAVQRQFARELPRQVARLVGVPAAMASHVGDVLFDVPMVPGVRWRTTMVGETQIAERDGTILARLTYEDGEGHIGADVAIARPAPLDPVEDRLWIPLMTPSVHAAWYGMNFHGRVKYQGLKALRRHPWQSWPGSEMPDETPATAGERPGARHRVA